MKQHTQTLCHNIISLKEIHGMISRKISYKAPLHKVAIWLFMPSHQTIVVDDLYTYSPVLYMHSFTTHGNKHTA